MLFSVLAAAAALSASAAAQPASAVAPAPMVEAVATAVLLDCQVSETGLTDCKALDAEGAKAEAAVKLAAQIEVPESFALANPGRIVIKMTVNP
ncbi:hypothetical protein [Phenylobacterium sp.]|uniref:hypothetical protein n=1 Tax=Phenylobacterium sp. TaxID=1871053 RepID=UPI0027324066|nr:hypothetical protein [Phenylobacterium sp.]MDP3855161.1 hypothetical protein [Phenylobacterium sp.]